MPHDLLKNAGFGGFKPAQPPKTWKEPDERDKPAIYPCGI